MKRKVTLWFVAFLFLSFILGFNLEVSQARKNEEELYRQLEQFVKVIGIVKDQYVTSIDDKKLMSGALKGLLSSLDPYSAYLEPEVAKELQIETQGEFEGVGMEIILKDGIITVVSPIEDSPAWKAGIKPFDKIIDIEGESTKGMTTLEAAKKLRGKKGTTVNISVFREKSPKLLKITLTRGTIKIKSVKTKILDNHILYVRLSEFQERSAADLEAALNANSATCDSLILDLRNNPGGLLSSAIDISQIFLEPKKLIVYTQGRKADDKKYYFSHRKPVWAKPTVILINGGSASASEILTGAIKDNVPSVKTVGQKSFGKGSVQNLINIGEDGASIKLTIAYYYTPSGVRIDGKGIEPDIAIEPNEETEYGVLEKDIQLQKALEALTGDFLPDPAIPIAAQQ
ncbi:MAG: S41 family peptidase [Candidatus Ratteibacteria bacterium]